MKTISKIFGLAMISTALVLSSCSKDDSSSSTSGKIDPGTIAKDSLIAYFPFESNGTDQVASLTPSTASGVTYVAGQRGNCYQGAESAYLLYNLPATSKLATMSQGFTVSAWIKSPKVYGDPVPMIFQVGKSTDHFWGNLTWMQERAGDAATGAAKDSLYYKFVFQAGNDSRWCAENYWSKFTPSKWQYITLSYSATTSTFSVYINGVLYAERSKVFKDAGALTFSNADKMVIGGWLTKVVDSATDVWMGWYKGNIDELRVYNYGLPATRVAALYAAEVTQL